MNEFEMTEEAMKNTDSWPLWLPKRGEFGQWVWGEVCLIARQEGVLTYLSAKAGDQGEEMEAKPGDVLFLENGRVGLRPKVPIEERESKETDRKRFSSLF